MASCDEWALLKAFEVLLSMACLIYKWWTDEEASKLRFYLEKISREWPLQNNVTWNQAGSWFADVTFGGYTIITIGLFVAHVIGELRHTRKTETFLLGIGALLFFGAGCMITTSFDNVPESLVDNAIILGLLAIFTGFIFVIDICCLRQRAYSDKVDRQEKEYRMKRAASNANKKGVVLKEKSSSKTRSVDTVDKPQEKVISELRSSMKKKQERSEDTSTFRVENEKVQKENAQYGRKYLDNRGFNQKNSKRKPSADEHNNGYDYDVQSIKNYDDRGSVVYTDSDDSKDSDSEPDLRYNRKSRGSQTSRKHIMKEKVTIERVTAKDAGTSTESPVLTKSSLSNGALQSAKVTTTDPHKSDSPTSEEGYKLHPAASSSYLISSGKKFQPVITTTRIERLTQNAQTINRESESVPSSPQDPGYVLHTASKWPNPKPLGPQPYQKWKDNKGLKTVQSVV